MPSILVVAVLLASAHSTTPKAADEEGSVCSAGEGAACGGIDSGALGDNVDDKDPVLKWAYDNGVQGLENVDIRFFNYSGHMVRGLAAAKKLEWGEIVIKIPEKLILTIHNSYVMDSPFHQVAGQLRGFKMPFALLLYVAAEHRRVLEGSSSFWAPWMKNFPTLEELISFHPLYAEAELTKKFKLLPGMDTLLKAQRFIQEAWDEHHQEWTKLAQEYGVETLTFADFKWAVVTFKCRSFDIAWGLYGYSTDSYGCALVPIADLTNHNFNNNLKFFEELKGDPPHWHEKLERTVRAGKELTKTYSEDMPPDEFYMHYGFLTTKNPNSQRMTTPPNKLCKAKHVAKMKALEIGTQPLILTGFKSLMDEFCKLIPVTPAPKPAPPPR